MNWGKLADLLNYRVRLRPMPKRFDGNQELAPEDDVWIVTGVQKKSFVQLENIRTGHTVRFGDDHIHNFTSDVQSNTDGHKHGFLILDVQLTLRGSQIEIEPIRQSRPTKPSEKWVDLQYASDSGIQEALERSGYQVAWATERTLTRKTELEGWEVVVAPDREGQMCIFKVKDPRDNSVLVKRKLMASR